MIAFGKRVELSNFDVRKTHQEDIYLNFVSEVQLAGFRGFLDHYCHIIIDPILTLVINDSFNSYIGDFNINVDVEFLESEIIVTVYDDNNIKYVSFKQNRREI